MAKAVAMLAVFSYAVYIGLARSKALSDRVQVLKTLHRQINQLSTLLVFSRLPLPELLKKAGGTEDGLLQRISGGISSGLTVYQSYQRSEEECRRQDRRFRALLEGDRQILQSFFLTLGTTDTITQLENAALAAKAVEAARQEAEEQYRTKGRLARTLGVIAGTAAAILIL